MKTKLLAFFCATALACPAALAAESPILGKDLNNGTYKIDVESSSSMFRVTDCELTVENGEMTAVMTLGGTGYEKLFMGTGEEALSAPDSEYIYFEEGADGKYSYAVPVEALGTDTACAAFSKRKQQWYDRTLVFDAASLPKEALKSGGGLSAVIGAAVGAAILVAAAALIFAKEKRKRKKEEK